MLRDRQPERRTMRIGATLLAAGIALAGLLAPDAGLAQYPSRPIRLLVPVSPGGAPDTLARVIGERLSPLLGQPVVVENRAGANGNIAMDLVAKSAPDGYTMMMGFDSMIVINPHMYRKMPVDTLKDLAPVATIAQTPNFFLVVHPSLPVKNFQEFVEYAKTANPPLAYSSGGNGSQHHMMMELLKLRAGMNLVHVPYKGGGPATIAAIAGEVSATFSGTSDLPQQIRAGKLRGLAVTGRNRSSLFPELPTIGEFHPGYQISTWLGFFSPAGVPDPAIAMLRANIDRVLAMPEVKERFTASGLEPYVTTPPEFAALIRSAYEKYGELVKQIGVKAD